MKKSAIIVAIVLMALLARPGGALAQATPAPINGSWEELKAIPPGDAVMAHLRNGKKLKGRLSSVSDSVLAITQRNKTTDLNRGDVLKVYRLISRSSKKSTMIGLGIGAGVGGLAGGVSAASGPGGDPYEYGAGILLVVALGGAIGALTGYLLGSRKHQELIYETT